jgi:glutamate racemase
VKVLVIACNRQCRCAARCRERYDVPVVGSSSLRFSGRSGHQNGHGRHRHAGDGSQWAYGRSLPHRMQLTSQACPQFVEFVEAGITSGPQLLAAAIATLIR